MKRVKCKSGIEGWEDYLQSTYTSKEEFLQYDEMYGIAKRLGYNNPENCWRANPLMQGSVNPSDLRKSPRRHQKTKLTKGIHFKKHSTMRFKTKKQKDRYARLLPNGIPRNVRIYDNGGETADRYTCVFTGNYTSRTNRSHWYTTFSTYPFHPQGIGLHGDSRIPIDVTGNSWGGPSIGKKCHLGTRIKFEDLPEDGKKFVLQDYLYLWDFTDEDGKPIK